MPPQVRDWPASLEVRRRWPNLLRIVTNYVGLGILAERAIVAARQGEEPYTKIVRFAFARRHKRGMK